MNRHIIVVELGNDLLGDVDCEAAVELVPHSMKWSKKEGGCISPYGDLSITVFVVQFNGKLYTY